MNLNQLFNEYKGRNSHSFASMKIRDDMKTNVMSKNLSYSRDYSIQQSFYPQMKLLRKRFAAVIRSCISDQDYECVLGFLNDHEFRPVRSTIHNIYELFETKFNTEVYICDDCGLIENRDQANYAYEGDTAVCSRCFNDYYYHERSEQYVHSDDENYSNDEDEDESVIGEYHSSSYHLGKIPSEFDKRKSQVFLGLELEMEVTDDYSRLEKAEYILDNLKFYADHKGRLHTYCLLENDGSLNNGFEMVTGYTGLDVHEKQLAFFKKPIRGLRSHDTQTCGLHIHIDKKHMSLNHAAKMILFINDSGNQKLIKSLARRSSNRFSKVLNKKADYSWLKSAKRSHDPLCNLNEDRYESLNFQNDRTVEFRLFKGTLKFETIMSCLEFTYATWFFCKDYGYQDLTTEKFFQFICKPENKADTKYLRAYLKEHLFNIPEIPKQNPRIENNQLVTAEI
jgi:hypothetical protein